MEEKVVIESWVPTPGLHLSLVGVTASGKSSIAYKTACQLEHIELISVDSMQVYRGMDIGTAKPSKQEQETVPHHLLDICEPENEFTVSHFQTRVYEILEDIEGRNKRAILVGGTGLYHQSIIDFFAIPGEFPDTRKSFEAEPDTDVLYRMLQAEDPIAASRIEANNRRRIIRALEVTYGSKKPFSSYGPGVGTYPETPFQLVGIFRPRSVIDERIERRYAQQLADGFLEEVQKLHKRKSELSKTALQALGYKDLFTHLDGECTLEEAVQQAIIRTRQFARKQERWFRRDPRISWQVLDSNSFESSKVNEQEQLLGSTQMRETEESVIAYLCDILKK